MRILVTGTAGFIGFHISKELLNDHKNIIYGVDNFDDYYSPKYKKMRINFLRKNRRFKFNYLDITNKKQIKLYLKNKKFDYVFHMAAQAGVRFAYLNPKKYIDVNVSGFLNLLKNLENKVRTKIFYASSSSVYGESNKFPVNENHKLNPKNIYGVSKLLDERIAEYFFRVHDYNIIGLRFFTVYGEWGRPDMFLMKLIKSLFDNSKFYLNNNGNHDRDFTYIGDVVHVIKKLMKTSSKKHQIYNVCSNQPQNIKKIIEKNKIFNLVKFHNKPLHKADVIKTHGSNKKIRSLLKNYHFSDINLKIEQIIDWYKNWKIYKIF